MDAKKVLLGLAAIAAVAALGQSIYISRQEPAEGQETTQREISVGARSMGIYCIDC